MKRKKKKTNELCALFRFFFVFFQFLYKNDFYKSVISEVKFKKKTKEIKVKKKIGIEMVIYKPFSNFAFFFAISLFIY